MNKMELVWNAVAPLECVKSDTMVTRDAILLVDVREVMTKAITEITYAIHKAGVNNVVVGKLGKDFPFTVSIEI